MQNLIKISRAILFKIYGQVSQFKPCLCLGQWKTAFGSPMLDRVNISVFANFDRNTGIPFDSRVVANFHNLTSSLLWSMKNGIWPFQPWSFHIKVFTKLDQNIPYSSGVMANFSIWFCQWKMASRLHIYRIWLKNPIPWYGSRVWPETLADHRQIGTITQKPTKSFRWRDGF